MNKTYANTINRMYYEKKKDPICKFHVWENEEVKYG